MGAEIYIETSTGMKKIGTVKPGKHQLLGDYNGKYWVIRGLEKGFVKERASSGFLAALGIGNGKEKGTYTDSGWMDLIAWDGLIRRVLPVKG